MKVFEQDTIKNEIGQEIHILDGEYGEIRVKSINPMQNMLTGEQWCPECHSKCTLDGEIWQCDNCGYQIFKDEADRGYGCPTLESSYEEDFG